MFWKDVIEPVSRLSARVIANQFGIEAALIKEGWSLRFIPGHLIRDGAGKLTDILLVATKGGAPARILGVFEVKAYTGAAAELRGVLQTTASGAPKALADLDAQVANTIRYRAQNLFDEAAAAYAQNPGVVPAPPALAALEQRLMAEWLRDTSQIMKDVDRLGAGKVVEILIGGKPTQVVLDAACWFYAVAPAEVAQLLGGRSGAQGVLTTVGRAVGGPDRVIRAYEAMETVLLQAGYPTFYWG